MTLAVNRSGIPKMGRAAPAVPEAASGAHLLDDAIQKDYVPVAEFGRYTIWHRKELTTPL
ncbi:MAG: hypothetical protein ABSD98_08130 [Candidatus Korobacteraceae bacterium]|jgi:hypothetical protein